MEKKEIQAIVNDVKSSLSQQLWPLAIKTRIKMAKGKVTKPEPENLEIDDYTRAIADRMCENHFSSKNGKTLLCQFIRNKPKLKSVEVNVKSGTVSKRFEKNDIIGALVAFKSDTKHGVVKLGWSFYNKNHETVPFTRKNAVRIAIIRALLDDIIGSYTSSKVYIPNSVSEALPDFASRITKYYFMAPDNVVI